MCRGVGKRRHAPPIIYSIDALVVSVLLLVLLFVVPQDPQVLSSSAAGTFRMDLYVILTRLERTTSSVPKYSTRSLEMLCLNSYRLGPFMITKDLRADKGAIAECISQCSFHNTSSPQIPSSILRNKIGYMMLGSLTC